MNIIYYCLERRDITKLNLENHNPLVKINSGYNVQTLAIFYLIDFPPRPPPPPPPLIITIIKAFPILCQGIYNQQTSSISFILGQAIFFYCSMTATFLYTTLHKMALWSSGRHLASGSEGHAFESWLCQVDVESLEKALYMYFPHPHHV